MSIGLPVAAIASGAADRPAPDAWLPRSRQELSAIELKICENPVALGAAAAEAAAGILRGALAERGSARLIVATGASQFEVLRQLIAKPGIEWSKIDGFHLDEYIGIAPTHPASFCRYLHERFVSHVPLRSFAYLAGDRDPLHVIAEVGQQLAAAPIDLALVGIGENGHLAFNDPPADFDNTAPYAIVQLDEACRRQQVGEGWFAGLEEVPQQAISMTIQQILKSRRIVCSVPEARKAKAVQAAVQGPVTPLVPASCLQQHPDTLVLLDRASAALLQH
jgi:glucosamine-6-phosphate deaminase